ncbi:C-C motif chemokine 19b [Salminus brasiliensis]|uniref:C-C motif chemokine 19b n=1 Tax=Salminus brasiliensis TaxID=930266 RepID=UPI003B83047F
MAGNSMMAHTAALLVLAVVFCSWNYAGAEGEDCCLSISKNKIPHRLVKSFYIQTADMGCKIPATVFITKKGVKLCAPPPENNNWVQKVIRNLKNRSRKKHKGKKQ